MSKSDLAPQSAWRNFYKIAKENSSSVATYTGVFVAAILGAIWVHWLTPQDLSYPWRVTDSDLSSIYSLAQATGQSWFGLVHHSLGAPFTADLSFAFIPDDLQIEFIRVLTHLTHNPFVAVNVFYLLTFGLCGVTFLLLADQFKLSRWISSPLALSYAWLPYHFTRMDVGHVFLAAYYMVPIGVVFLHRLFQYLMGESDNYFPKRLLLRALYVLGIIAVGSSGTYYGFFFALLTAPMIFLAPQKGISVYVTAKRVATTISVSVLFILAPLIRILISKYRGLETVLTRSPEESVQFGGSIARLLVPWGTWLPQKLTPLVSKMEYEWNASPLLGVLGVWILIIGITSTLAGRSLRSTDKSLSFIFIWALLLYTASGLGLVFAYGIDSSFRCWNRLSIVIMTLALIALAKFLSGLKFSHIPIAIILVFVTAFTQLSPLNGAGIGAEPDETSRAAFRSLKVVAAYIQKEIEPGCKILQLPIMEFPEGGQVGQVGNGNHLWLPLLTQGFHWSYGAPKGSLAGDYWSRYKLDPIETIVETAANNSFCAILSNRQSGTEFNANALSPYILSKAVGDYVLYLK
jgi:phosphoglycerol transferase